MEDPTYSFSLLQDRLSKVQKAVHKSTEDAWKQASLLQHSSTGNSISPRSTLAQAYDGEDDDDKASFHLGMDLFGQDTSTLERGIRDKLEDVELELQKVLKLKDEIGELSANEDLHQGSDTFMAMDPVELSRQVATYQGKIRFLKQASLARSKLDESITASSAALTAELDLKHASSVLQDALRDVQDLQASDRSSLPIHERQVAEQILQGLQHEIRRQRVALLHKASTVLDQAIQIQPHTLSVKSTAALTEAYQVLETFEGGSTTLQETMRRFTRRLYDEALSPILEPHRGQAPTGSLAGWKVSETEDQPTNRIIGVTTSSSRGVVHRLEWHRQGDEEEDNLNEGVTATIQEEEEYDNQLEWPVGVWKDTLQTLKTILIFVQKRILLERQPLSELVGNKLFGKADALPSNLNLNALGLDSVLLGDDHGLLMDDLMNLMSKNCLPDQLSASDIQSTLDTRGKELLYASVPFCKELVDCGLMPLEPPPKLVAFCKDFSQKYVEHRRSVLLNQARNILRDHDYHNTVTVGTEEVPDATMAIYQFHKSSVSQIASHLMALLRQTMDESVEMPTEPATLRPTLYKTAREMLSLFRAVIPASHGNEIANVPRTAAVLHNDCLFFAHHCLTLGVEYREQYSEEDARGKLLKQTCIFLDMVPLFRELADQSLGDMLDLQANQLAEIVGSRISYLGQALGSNESLHEWGEAETALAAGIYHLRHLGQSWKPILSMPVFAQSMGHLADVIMSLYWNQITQHAPSISPNARNFLLGLLRKATEELKTLLPKEGLTELREVVGESSLEWVRFQALIQYLEMTHLGQVQAALTSGVFRQVSGHELSQWLMATYPDTRERHALLEILATGSH